MAHEYDAYETCCHCKGTGEVPDYPSGDTQPPTTTKTCPECSGTGKKLIFWLELAD